MRILSLDPGTVRVGVAVSDELKMIATPVGFIEAEPFEGFVTRLKALLAEKPCETILVGMPRNMDGSLGPSADRVKAFIEQLRTAVDLPIRTWDERLTSVQAHRLLREGGVKGRDQKKRVDATAAAILLQSFLDVQGGM